MPSSEPPEGHSDRLRRVTSSNYLVGQMMLLSGANADDGGAPATRLHCGMPQWTGVEGFGLTPAALNSTLTLVSTAAAAVEPGRVIPEECGRPMRGVSISKTFRAAAHLTIGFALLEPRGT